MAIEIVSVNISKEKGTVKSPVPEITFSPTGIVEDAHAGSWHRQVSLLAEESIVKFAQDSDRIYKPGEFAENITTRGIDNFLKYWLQDNGYGPFLNKLREETAL